MISLQANLTDLQKVVATNDATVTGILIAVVLAFGVTIIYLYKNIQTLNKDHMNELRSFNETLLKVNNSYNEFVKNMVELKGK
jgi:hypothetical protein